MCNRGVAKVFSKEAFELFQKVSSDLGTFDIEIINPRVQSEAAKIGLDLSRRIVAIIVEVPEQGQDEGDSKLPHSDKLIDDLFFSLDRVRNSLLKSSTAGDCSLLLFAISKRSIFAIGSNRVTDLSEFSVAIDTRELRRMSSGSNPNSQIKFAFENSILETDPPLLIDHILKFDDPDKEFKALRQHLAAFVE